MIVGASGVVLTSTNATSWTSRTSGVSTALNSVCWGDSQFVAVGAVGRHPDVADRDLEVVQPSPYSGALNSVIYADSIFVAVGANGT